MTKSIGLIASLVLLACSSVLCAQVANEGLANKVIAARQKSNGMLQQYTWYSRIEILKDGNVKDTRIEQITYGAGGQPQRTLMNDVGSPLPHGFFRKAIAKNEREQTEKYLKGLQKLIEQYTLPTAGSIVNFLQTANIMTGTSPEGTPILKTTGTGVVNSDDTLSFTFDANTFAVRRMEVNTTFQGDPVTLTATFRTLPSGLTHMQFATVDVPDKSITVQMHNYDYVSND